MPRQLRIGELVQLTRVTVKALRLYETFGLVMGARRSGVNYRVFDEKAVFCVRGIRQLQDFASGPRDGRDVRFCCRTS